MASILRWCFRTGVLFFLLTGVTSVVHGPSEQSGFLGRSLSVTCTYDRDYRKYIKYWCRGAKWSSCQPVVKTEGTEAEVKAQRTSIKDDHTHFRFTVRMEDLAEQDAGVYWCAIERSGSDFKTSVTITVLPEPTTTAASTTECLSTTSDISPESSDQDILLIIVLPIAFLVLTAILVTASLIMCKIKKQKAAKARGDIMLSTAPKQTVGNTFSGAELQNHNKTTFPSSDEDTKCAEEVEYASVTAASHASPPQLPEDTEDVAYTTLRFPDLNENAIYANTR